MDGNDKLLMLLGFNIREQLQKKPDSDRAFLFRLKEVLYQMRMY